MHKVSAGYINKIKRTEAAIKRGQKARIKHLANVARNAKRDSAPPRG